MNSKKKTWTQFVAVAAAAACAISATAAGMTINHADAADGDSYVAFLRVHDNNWAVKEVDNESPSAITLSGDGSYSITVTNNNSYSAVAWNEGEMAWILEEAWMPVGTSSFTEFSIDSVVFPDATYEDVKYSLATNQYPTFIEDGKEVWTHHCAIFTIDLSTFTDSQVDPKESITVNFTIGEKSDESTTTTIATTTTTTATTTTVSGATTTTTEEGATTTTTTTAATTTTQATTTTTKATTTTARTSVLTPAKQTEKGDDGNVNAFVEFDPDGAESATIYYKVLSDDKNTSGAIGTWNGEWVQEEWTDLAVPTDGIIIREYKIPADVGETVKAMVFWPGAANVQFQKVVLNYGQQTEPVVPPVESDLKFETYKIIEGGDATGKFNMDKKCLIIETIKGKPGDMVSAGIYHGNEGDANYLKDEWKEKIPASGLIEKIYDLRKAGDVAYGFYPAGSGDTVLVNIQTFYEGDASMNGKVNGSDVRAIVDYIKSGEKTDAQDILCDFNDDDNVDLSDVVALTKFILGSSSQKGAVVNN